MRVAHCVLEPRYSGAEILVLGLVRAQLAAGVPTALVALRPAEAAFEPELKLLEQLGCRLFVPTHRLGRVGRAVWIRRAAQQWRPDVLFAHSALPSVYSRIALPGGPVSLVTVLHTDDDFADRALRMFERLTWGRNAMVIGVSPASVRNYSRRITRRQKIRLIANGIDIGKIRSASELRDDVRRQIFGAAPDEVIALQVGRISPQKQQLFSAQAFAALKRKLPTQRVRLVFAGMEEYKDYHAQIRESVRSLGIEGSVEFLGSRSDIPALLAGADVHLMPSGWEAHALVALEAIASGIYCFFTPLESFKGFGEMPGVTVLPEAADAECFATLLAKVIRESAAGVRYARSIDQYGIENCANEYLILARGLASRA